MIAVAGPRSAPGSQGTAPEGFPYSELRKTGVATGAVDGEAYVVFWTPGTATALGGPLIDQSEDVGSTGVFRPIAEGRQLTFERSGGEEAPITDVETGLTWSITGRAVAGGLEGRALEPVIHGDHFWFAWVAFAPDTKIWTAP